MFGWVNEEFRIDSKVPSPFKPRFRKFMTGSFRLQIGIISVTEIISMVGIISMAVQGLETKFEETAGQMTVGHIRLYKFVRFDLKGF